jgi:hypothetical protein
MSKVVRVSDGDYKIITQLGGRITLDTGNQIGSVVITGDLVVEGDTTTVESETLTIRDNIIYLNVGETGNGVTLGLSGFAIERGTRQDAQLLWDESITYVDSTGTNRQGAFSFKEGSLGAGLQTSTIFTGGGDLSFNTGATGTGVLSVSQVPNYEDRVTDDDDIPNRRYVQDYVLDLIADAPIDGFYRYLGTVKLDTGGKAYDTGAGDPTSKIEFEVDGFIRTTINNSGLFVDNINLFGNRITTLNNQLSLSANSNLVDVEATLGLQDQLSTPVSVSGKNIVYSSAVQGPGATGLYFTNTTTSDELVSRRRSLVFSMIF